jgi:hypothetical protein
MATDPSTQTPVEIDTVLATNYDQQAKLWGQIRQGVAYIEHLKNRKTASPYWDLINRTTTEVEGYRAEVDALITQAAPLQLEYNRRPWNRYFLVTNANGHVHRGLDCTTCFHTTEYSWLVDLADCDEAAMIEEWGERACTVCFPTAPTNPNFHRPARIDREAAEAKAAEKAAKQADKDAKGITDVDGSPLRGEYGVIATKVAARNALSQAFQSLAWYGLDHPSDFAAAVRRLVPALNAAGVDWQRSATNAVAKVAKEQAKPNPYAHQLTAEQVADTAAKSARNLAQAQALLAEVLD